MGTNVFMFYLFSATILFFSVLAVTSRRILRAAVFLLFALVATSGYLFYAAIISFWQGFSFHFMPVVLWCSSSFRFCLPIISVINLKDHPWLNLYFRSAGSCYRDCHNYSFHPEISI